MSGTFGEGKVRKIIKDHVCLWCGRTIIPRIDKQAYQYKGMYDGDWQNWYMHIHCEEATHRCHWVELDGEIPEHENNEGITQEEYDEIVNCYHTKNEDWTDTVDRVDDMIDNKKIKPYILLSTARL